MDLLDSYRLLLRNKLVNHSEAAKSPPGSSLSTVGIVGGGISGLYSALLLQQYAPDVKIKVFEANNRVGGRIFTYKFSNEPHQYCEAGAMRIPCITSQEHVFKLIDYLNQVVPEKPLELIEFINSCPAGNLVYLNGTKVKEDGQIMTAEYANTHCSELGFSPSVQIKDGDNAWKLMMDALKPVIAELEEDFEKAIDKYSPMSLQQYLISAANWSLEKVNYFEMMGSMTNETHCGLLDMLIPFFSIFGGNTTYKTIAGGLSLLPEKCATLVSSRGGEIALNSKVESISHTEPDNSVVLSYREPATNTLSFEKFDAVILAVPSPCVRNLNRPRWPKDVEYALRSIRHIPIIKLFLRFKTRFWERSDLQRGPSLGGFTFTDLQIRRVCYPPYGLGDVGQGILGVYTHTSDAMQFTALSDVEKVQLILRDLQTLYPEVDVASEYAGGTNPSSLSYLAEIFVMDWTTQWTMGVAGIHYPGHFRHIYSLLAQNQGNVYFAGDHLSVNPIFIAGALDSTKFAVQQLVQRQFNQDLVINFL